MSIAALQHKHEPIRFKGAAAGDGGKPPLRLSRSSSCARRIASEIMWKIKVDPVQRRGRQQGLEKAHPRRTPPVRAGSPSAERTSRTTHVQAADLPLDAHETLTPAALTPSCDGG